MNVRVRGIYATALTRRLNENGHDVVQASDPIRNRFDESFGTGPSDATVETTTDRLGVGVTGETDAVADVADAIESVGVDVLAWTDSAARDAVFDGVVEETLGSGALVDLGDRVGFLPFDAVDGYVDEGDRIRVQVHEEAPPWSDRNPDLGGGIRVETDLVTLSRGREGVTAAVSGERATELVRTTELLDLDWPDGWGVRWLPAALDVDMDVMRTALEDAADRARDLAEAIDDGPEDVPGTSDTPTLIAAPTETRWIWFGRESRFALDDIRREVTTTMTGHHRIKAGNEAAGGAVDFVEALCDPDDEFPFDVVTRQFGPTEGDGLLVAHGKPEGQTIVLGRGEVTERDPDGRITLRREASGSGTYDALGTPRERGDVAITKFTEGRWWYPTAYRGADGERKGTYVNICTPVEIFPDEIRYVDLHVDVVKYPDGSTERVDDDELDEAVEEGYVSEDLAEKAREVASRVEKALG
ncbi:MAG: hypothetical protein ACI9YT_001468 [Halobacteriales archaeon]|jgi:hypothetical protein